MATAAATPAIPGAKGPRMCRAVVDLGGDILRDALYYHIKPAVIVSYVLASRYFRNHPLNPHQTAVLQNASTKGDYSECDITLLYSLLRNLPPTNTALRPTAGWGKLPVEAWNTSLGDDIERIRDIRNEVYGHVATTYIPDVLYTRYMAELQAVCLRMDHNHAVSLMSTTPHHQSYTQILQYIQVTCMDPDSEARYTDEIRRMRETDRQTRDLISDVEATVGQVQTCQVAIGNKLKDMSSKLHQTEEGGDSLQTGQDTLTSLVETMEREFTSMKTRQCTLACNVDIMDKHQKVKIEAQELKLVSHERTLESQHAMFELNRGDIDCLNKRTEQQNKTLERHGEQIEQQGREMEAHTAQLEQLTNQLPAVLHVTSDDIARIQTKLIEEYEGVTRVIQMMPIDEDEGLSLHEIYGSVLVEEDLSAVKKTRRPDEPSGSKTLDSVRDMFYVQDKLARRIILQGEAGYGKTVFCMKALDCWSKAKLSRLGAEGETGGGSVEIKHMVEYSEGAQGNESDERSVKKLLTTAQYKSEVSQSCLSSSPSSSPDDDDDDHDHDDHDDHDEEDKELQRCLSLFDLVFYVPLRHSKDETSSIVDLVCNSIPECDQGTEYKIKQMLRDDSITCLIILDGLDEWRAPDTCRIRGLPDSDGLVNCTLLCTMRPWRMVNLQLGLDCTRDIVVHILGLKRNSIKTVISNVLVNFYGLKQSSALFTEKFSCFCRKAELRELESLVKIPLMLTASCLVWNEEDDVSNEEAIDQAKSYFMTFFYLKLEEITITRAENKDGMVKSFLFEKRQKPDSSINVPSILSEFEQIIDFIEILKPVGRLALQDLVSDEPHLVFPRNKLEREIGQSKAELALKAGILSQTKAPGLSYQQRVSLSFYHKSIQEFIAALYMTCDVTGAITSFRTHCNTVDKVMELSNMIKFVFGLDPVVGCQLSEHIRDVVNSDPDFMQYRERGMREDEIFHGSTRKIKELFKMQCQWFSEMKQNLSYIHNTNHTPTFHVTDVYLMWSNPGDISMASELVSMEGNSIVSVCLNRVSRPVHSIIQYLPGCKHLTALCMRSIENTQDVELLTEVLPQLVHLQSVMYGHSFSINGNKSPADTAVVHCLQQLPALKRIELRMFTLTEIVTLPSELQEVILGVHPANFILPSLPKCPHLTSLHIRSLDAMEDCEVLVSVLPQLQHLQYVKYEGAKYCSGPPPPTGRAAVVRVMQQLTQLRHIVLRVIDLGDAGTLLITPNNTQLREVKLDDVTMSGRRWTEFFSSLQHATQLTHIELKEIKLRSIDLCEDDDDDLGDACTLLITPQMTQLQKVKLWKVKMSGRRWTEFFSSLQHATQLRHIELMDIKLGRINQCDDADDDDDLGDACTLLITPQMTKLQKVKLSRVKMSARRWTEFFSSLLTVQQTVHVNLKYTNIDVDTVKFIHSSTHFCKTKEERDNWDNSVYKLVIYTVK